MQAEQLPFAAMHQPFGFTNGIQGAKLLVLRHEIGDHGIAIDGNDSGEDHQDDPKNGERHDGTVMERQAWNQQNQKHNARYEQHHGPQKDKQRGQQLHGNTGTDAVELGKQVAETALLAIQKVETVSTAAKGHDTAEKQVHQPTGHSHGSQQCMDLTADGQTKLLGLLAALLAVTK